MRPQHTSAALAPSRPELADSIGSLTVYEQYRRRATAFKAAGEQESAVRECRAFALTNWSDARRLLDELYPWMDADDDALDPTALEELAMATGSH